MKTTTKTLLCLFAAMILVALPATRIYVVQQEDLSKAERSLTERKAVLLDEETNPALLSNALTSHGYILDEDEAAFISTQLVQRIRSEEGGRPESLKKLSDKKFGLALDSAGFSSISNFAYLSSRAETLAGGPKTDLVIRSLPEKASSRKYTVVIRRGEGGIHREPVFLRIREHYNEPDTNKKGEVVDYISRDSIFAWVPVCGRTDIWLPEKNGLGEDRYFSAIPVERGYVFGAEQGTYKLFRHRFKFERTRATLPLLGREILKKAREDNSILVRSPREYREKYIFTFAIWGALWILSFLILSYMDLKRKGKSNLELLSFAALISGLGLVNLFGISNPLWGELYAWSQLIKGFTLGIALLLISSYVDWSGIYVYSNKLHLESGRQSTQGIWMASAAICIAFILWKFGSGPGGSHVNLPFIGIQGSPLIKILVIGYLSVFFASRGDLIEAYSKPGKMRRQLLVLLAAIIICAALGIIQLAISDLGPFLVIAIAAIFMWSLYTEETIPMLLLSGIFGAVTLILNRLGITTDYPILPFALFGVITIMWSLISHLRYRMVMLSPIIMSLVILLSFHGGTIFSLIGDEDIASRLDGRTIIAASPFDNEVPGGSQIAEGIWAITRGGLIGSPKNGLASTLPAGHTDLIVESVIATTGISCAIIILICIFLIIFTSLKIGIRQGHPFGFCLASLIAMTMGVQSVLIILGSLGIVPLSGLPLPFCSYGGTSLAVDLACIGILISISRKQDYELENLNTRKFGKVSKGLLWAYIIMALTALAVIFYYGLICRDKYMVKTGTFINNKGDRITVVNPLVDEVQKQLQPGDIFDCKGRLLAGTDTDGNRIYPYKEHTLFTLFDSNTKSLWGTAGKSPSGLGAEERYKPYICGYDTKPVKKTITSHSHYSPYLPAKRICKDETLTVKDYRPLIPLMKSEAKIAEWNEKKDERKISLTVDAELQMMLSNNAAHFVKKAKASGLTSDRTIAGICIKDAADGSLLASSMYPLPNQDTLKRLALEKRYLYKDWTPDFKAYAYMDVNLVPLAPGSSIKIITAGAALAKFSTSLADEKIMVYDDEIIDISLGEPVGLVNLYTALGKSSNIFFIKLLNQYGDELYPYLASLYYAVGAKFGDAVPYTLYPDEVITSEQTYNKQVIEFGKDATKKFSDYMARGTRHRLIDAEYQPAWGQGQVSMSPLSLANYVAAVAHDGVMMAPRYSSTDDVKVHKRLLSEKDARLLQYCMKGQASRNFVGDISRHIGGKTGTPNRTDRTKASGKSNDALYCFFIDGEGTTSGHPLACVIRLERVNANSRLAMRMASEVVIPTLRENGYIN